jgi:hypothetical protein
MLAMFDASTRCCSDLRFNDLSSKEIVSLKIPFVGIVSIPPLSLEAFQRLLAAISVPGARYQSSDDREQMSNVMIQKSFTSNQRLQASDQKPVTRISRFPNAEPVA